MNKFQEALDRLKELTVSEEHLYLYSLLQELIDKETPMKPNLFLCPSCGDDFICEETIRGNNRYFNRCECGQKIDWSYDE